MTQNIKKTCIQIYENKYSQNSFSHFINKNNTYLHLEKIVWLQFDHTIKRN